MSIESFDKDIQKFAKKSGLEVDKVVKKVVLQAWRGVTLKTPVDTGRARGNWNLSEGSIDGSINNSATTIKAYREPKGKKDVYITNSLPYIGLLEKGSSKQAPKGMVSTTMNEIRSQFK
jgi:hypothetical protein